MLGANVTKVGVETAWGRADPVLLALAKETEADLIVLGTHQRHGFGRFWLGSVSRAVLRDATVNVVVVPHDARSGISKAILGSVAQDVMARSTRPVLVVR
jgi:nucleotide-binding universal stress UspA family protein